MKVLDSIPLIKMAKDKTAEEKEFLAQHDGEYDDLVQMRAQGVVVPASRRGIARWSSRRALRRFSP